MNFSFSELHNYKQSLFLLFLSIAGNFVAETLSCGSQRILSNNMFIKSLIIFFMIYFTMDFSSTEVVNPIIQLRRSILLWVFLLIFTKMNIYFTGVSLLLLVMTYIMNNFVQYYSLESEQNKDKIERISGYIHLFELINLLLILVGFTRYYLKQQKDHKNFSFSKFIFGVTKCSN